MTGYGLDGRILRVGKANEGNRLERPRYLKRPTEEPVKGSPREVKGRVSEMLSRIERERIDQRATLAGSKTVRGRS